MSVATSLSSSSLPSLHQEFVAALPKMNRVWGFHFRGLRSQERKEAAAEARAAAWAAWHSLRRRGKDPLVVGVVGIANTVARHIKSAHSPIQRSVGEERDGHDALKEKLQARGFRFISFTDAACDRDDSWHDLLVSNTRYTPADAAAFRCDFRDWLERLPPRKRRTAELLAAGHQTGDVAQALDVSPGRVSQTRAWLAHDWRDYQGELETGSAQSTRPRAGRDVNSKQTPAARRA
jgi:hypothetical protein